VELFKETWESMAGNASKLFASINAAARRDDWILA
jgi:hypothetical protein